ALGPGGLNRKRAGFEVRDVHTSHYGRICPIETPEGVNIGLIASLTIFSALDKYGFLVTPYYPVKKGRVQEQLIYLRADQEKDKVIAPADARDVTGRIAKDKVLSRYNGEFQFVTPEKIDYIDVSPNQMVGLSAGLIPFLEHDDANRALMGSNMQRQAVPLLNTEPALVVTGLEKHAAANSSMVVTAVKEGVVNRVTADQIIIGTETNGATKINTYNLRKFVGLNERTCLNQKPIVEIGQRVRRNQVIADGAGTAQGELALGRNVLVAFMLWEGYNFEDAIIVSERLLKDDVFTSLHIEDFEVEARETKLGQEEFTRDIPNVSEKALKNLDENGIILVGTKIKPGDILVGKITPKSKSELTPEEKLLHAIFGKAGEDVKNESLEVPPGVDGIVIDTQRFTRKVLKSEKEKKLSNKKMKKIDRDINVRLTALLEEGIRSIERIVRKRLVARPIAYGPRGSIKSIEQLKGKLNIEQFEFESRKDKDVAIAHIKELVAEAEKLENERELKINRLMRGDDLPTGVLEMVKVTIASKRRLSVGDKIAGRHGNKGVIAKILPLEDMPFMSDGTHVDIILNPLGVPSRMNVGQLLETHLGWSAKKLNFQALTPVFNGATEAEITDTLKEAGLAMDGKVTLFDGRTGKPFDERIMIGYAYIMKLHHLVDDKIHARATGPYSLITQQPLGGKARYGGQRFGEMEVWALEAYGASNTLQEMLTVKSDDVDGRTKIYESMIKGDNLLEPSTPVSFEVLNNEIKGLCLNLKLEKEKKIID
ncbi:MAG: DNA-directed RNA polymerase subunit beta, partial [Planctomycetes bacterium]|nr:DNA-directed RNA polymerase subunit beta [Planctomycetota bacterium]